MKPERPPSQERSEFAGRSNVAGAASGAAAISLHRRAAIALLALDVVGLLVFLNIAFWLRLDVVPWIEPGMAIPLAMAILGLYVLDTYALERQVAGMRAPARAVVGVAAAGVLTGAAAYAGGFWSVDPTFGRGIFPVAFVLQAAWSAVWRFVLGGWVREQGGRIRWLVIGSGEQAQTLREDFDKSATQGELVFVDETASAGGVEQLAEVAPGPWSGVVVALGDPAPERLVQQLMALRFAGARVYGIPDFYEQLWFKVPVLHTRHGWLLFAHGFDLLHNPLGLRVKRLSDVVLSLAFLVPAIPVIAIAAVLVRLESRGPAIFRQIRTGLGGAEFEILKLRTMREDAEAQGPQWAQPTDPRVTSLGRVLRTLRIDELPQLWNVLKGDMSFIGPRPERPVFNARLEKEIPLYNLRHLVRPGITGWAQVMYSYGASVEDAREKLQYDLYYIKNYSLLLDVGIIFKTLRVVLLGLGR